MIADQQMKGRTAVRYLSAFNYCPFSAVLLFQTGSNPRLSAAYIPDRQQASPVVVWTWRQRLRDFL